MERDEDAGWSNPKVLAILAVMFACGAMFGAVAMREFMHARMPSSTVQVMDAARRMPADDLAKQLKLTPNQSKEIMVQLDEYAKYYQNIEEERSDVAHHGLEAIRKLLTDDQRQQFDGMFRKKR